MGYGPLQAGITIAEASRVTEGRLQVATPAVADQCDYAIWTDGPSGVAVMFVGGVLARVDVNAAGIATAEGLEVGQPLARAESLYATTARRLPHKYTRGEYFVVLPLAPMDTVHRLVIEIDQGRVTTFRVGRHPPVEYVEGCS